MMKSKITSNYRFTLIKDVRRIMNVNEGDKIMFIVDGNNILLTKAELAIST